MKNLIAVILAAAAAVGIALSQEKVDQRRPASPDAKISIENIAGSVVVAGWSREEVEVTGTLGAGTQGLEFTGERDRISIDVKFPKTGRSVELGESNLTIHVPRGSRLTVETVSARIDLSEFEGEAEMQSISGVVHVDGSPRSVDLSTVSGSLTLTGKGALANGQFKTISGDVEVEADFSPNGRFRIETVSGGVVLKLRRGISADLDVSSFSGSIENDFGETPRRSNPYLPSSELKFSLAGGGASVSVQTLSGRIRLKQP